MIFLVFLTITQEPVFLFCFCKHGVSFQSLKILVKLIKIIKFYLDKIIILRFCLYNSYPQILIYRKSEKKSHKHMTKIYWIYQI